MLLNVISVFHTSVPTCLEGSHIHSAALSVCLIRLKHLQVMHMDLKASNVLMTKTNSIAKIGDVDGAQVMGSTTLQRPRAATFAYSAPELILNGACTEKVSLASQTDGFSRKGMERKSYVFWHQSDEKPSSMLGCRSMASAPTACQASACLSTLAQHVHWVLCKLCALAATQGALGLQVDMYSFGAILWELITTEVPRRGRLRGIKVRSLIHLLVQLWTDIDKHTCPSKSYLLCSSAGSTVQICSCHHNMLLVKQ